MKPAKNQYDSRMEEKAMMEKKEIMEEMVVRISDAARAEFGEACKVSFRSVMKNNGLAMQAVEIWEPGMSTHPCIYIDNLLGKIASGELDAEGAAQMVVKIHKENKDFEEPLDVFKMLDKQAVLEKVEYQLINAGRNKDRLARVPHKPFLDLAAVYRVVLGEFEKGPASFLVSGEICERYGLCEEEIDAAAMRNMERQGFRSMTMDSVIAEIMGNPEDAVETGCPMWVLTNAKRLNGASAMLFPEIFEELSDGIEGDLYVLPSSIHEVIAVPTNVMDPAGLRALVGDVNSSNVPEEDFLSGNVYRYSREDGKISIAQEG